ncbi:MAG: type VI secretion system baseplate subunit TssF [Deltaproteobacteria bacterium]|jgi:type VI secretion system protein ImpG|nr:type VI secretion system baseplate subunit TssF [Deltaproteobacteria bacterium]
MLKNYYQEELDLVRELAQEFSRDNPAIASLLGAKGDDPDVERLLEGVAFMSSLVRQSLDEGFPQLIQSLLQLLYPQALLPTPSYTMMLFQVAQGFIESINLRAGSEVASVAIGGAKARFTTTDDLWILPAAVQSVTDERSAGAVKVTLVIKSPAPLASWLPEKLSIYCAGEFAAASERRRLLLQHSARVEAGTIGQTVPLPKGSLEPGGLKSTPGKPLTERLSHALSIMQEYFAVPHKFLFLELSGIRERVNLADNELRLVFVLDGFKGALPSLRPEHFLLNVVPAVNVFRHQAIPIIVDHKKHEYLLRPQDSESERISIYRVLEVSSRAQDGSVKPYLPFEQVANREKGYGCYTVSVRKSPISGLAQHFIGMHYLKDSTLGRETLSVGLECNNLGLTEQIRTGEINQPTDSSPAMARFFNIIPPTRHVGQLGSDSQSWTILSHLHVNLAPVLDAESLRELLGQYSLPGDTDMGRKLGNRKRIEAIQDLSLRREDHFVRGRPIHGYRLELTLDQSGFASMGDLRLFGDVLDHFLGLFHHLNTYSRLSIIEKNSREVISWVPRLGTRRLI